MGTRRSRHNKGRKPRYKDFRVGLSESGDMQPLVHRYGGNVLPLVTQEAIADALVAGAPLRRVAADIGISTVTANNYAKAIRKKFEDYQRNDITRTDEPSHVRQAQIQASDLSATQILARGPRGKDGWLGWTRTPWGDREIAEVKALCLGAAGVSASAEVLGRDEKSIAWKARDLGLKLPPEWSRLIRSPYVRRERAAPLLQFPYVAKARPEHADLLAVNDLIPKGMPEWCRADIVQTVMLALFEGTVSMEELRHNRSKVRWFIGKFYKEQMPREEVQMGDLHGDDDRSYEDIAAGSWVHDRAHDEMNERRNTYAALSYTHQPAEQVNAVYEREISAAHWKLYRRDKPIDRADVEQAVEDGDVVAAIARKDDFGTRASERHFVDRCAERYGVRISEDDAEALQAACRSGAPLVKHGHGEIHYLELRGVNLPVVYRRATNELKTVLPPIGMSVADLALAGNRP